MQVSVAFAPIITASVLSLLTLLTADVAILEPCDLSGFCLDIHSLRLEAAAVIITIH